MDLINLETDFQKLFSETYVIVKMEWSNEYLHVCVTISNLISHSSFAEIPVIEKITEEHHYP